MIKIQEPIVKEVIPDEVYDAYTPGLLLLIEVSSTELDNLPLEGIKDTYVWLLTYDKDSNIPYRMLYKPYIISDTEPIDQNDTHYYSITLNKIVINNKDSYLNGDFKVLVYPEQFTIDQLNHFSTYFTVPPIYKNNTIFNDFINIEVEPHTIDISRKDFPTIGACKHDGWKVKLIDNKIPSFDIFWINNYKRKY